MPLWLYIIAAILGSLGGAVLDYVVYADGGSMFLKVGLVAGPLLVWALSKRREGGSDG